MVNQAQMYIILFIFSVFQLSNGNDMDHLLAFKTSIKDPTQALSSWNTSTPICSWNGITCSNTSSHHVLNINLSGKNISGNLSSSLFRLPSVDSIDVSNNQLQGTIPQGVFSSLSLHYLNLSNNNLTGRVPDPVPGSALETLDLFNNMISGKIPENLGWFANLRYLDFGGNALVGRIPRSISNMTNLEYLTLASNQLVGDIPYQLGRLTRLKWVYLGYNKLSGIIPTELGMLNSLFHLDLVYNNLTGEIPSTFGNLTSLKYLFLYQNKLSGIIPPSIFLIQSLISLDLSDNFLSGEIPQNLTQLKNLQVLHLFSNNLTGTIPDSISSLPQLQVLQLWSNNLHGHIPQDLGKNNNLTILDLSTNSLTGRIPKPLCATRHLYKLILFSNSLEGEIPPSLGSCHSLERVRMENNSLSGRIPQGFTKLESVYYLDISSNRLSGYAGEGEWRMPSLQMLNLAKNKIVGELPDLSSSHLLETLDLSENEFWGLIPSSYGKLAELMSLKLERNQISGPIPEELASCNKLVTLDLSHNGLTGPIPSGLGRMPVLGSLDLSDNRLSGEIPGDLGAVDSLVEVNISHNHLHGELPSTGAFLAINSSAVEGNQLCGGDRLPPCHGVKDPTMALWWGLGISIGAIMVVVAFSLCMVAYIKRRKNNSLLRVQRLENEDVIWEVQFFDVKASKIISKNVQQIISRKYNVIKNDVLEYVVEDLSVNNLWEEVVQFGKIKHANVVKLLGACKSEKGGLLIYEKVEGNCLSEVLHGLNWGRRRKIALGIARALKFLHYNCSPSILVGEMSPERVIVGGEDGEARLRLGVGGLFCLGPKSFLSSAYVAPETKEAKEITDKNDIYGFWLILIELLTGRGPTDAEQGAHNDTVSWARYCFSDCRLETWLDPVINEQRLDKQNEIVEAMNLALQCTARDPNARPCSKDVVKVLECSFVKTRSCVRGMEITK